MNTRVVNSQTDHHPKDIADLRAAVQKGEIPASALGWNREHGSYGPLSELPGLDEELRDWLKEQAIKKEINDALHRLRSVEQVYVVDRQGYVHIGKLSVSYPPLMGYYRKQYEDQRVFPPAQSVTITSGWFRSEQWTFDPSHVHEVRGFAIILKRDEACDSAPSA